MSKSPEEIIYIFLLEGYSKLLYNRLISIEEFDELCQSLDSLMRQRAVARAKYKVGDRVCRSNMRQPFEIEEIFAARPNGDFGHNEDWQYEPAYKGRRLVKSGKYSKFESRVKVTEKYLEPFIP